jgi:hypothetical protein
MSLFSKIKPFGNSVIDKLKSENDKFKVEIDKLIADKTLLLESLNTLEKQVKDASNDDINKMKDREFHLVLKVVEYKDKYENTLKDLQKYKDLENKYNDLKIKQMDVETRASELALQIVQSCGTPLVAIQPNDNPANINDSKQSRYSIKDR